MDYKKIIKQKIAELKESIEKINTLEELKQLRSKYNKDEFTLSLRKTLKETTDLIVKKSIGQLNNEYSKLINTILFDKQQDIENSHFLVEKENLLLKDVKHNINSLKTNNGILHPLTKMTNEFKSFFKQYNYEFVYGKEVETEVFNFDILNIHSDHPSRTMHDSLYFTNNKMLRTHCTNVTARKLHDSKKDNNFFYSIGSVFRNDDNDATHSFQFNQIDLFATGLNTINISHLVKIINELLFFIFGKNTKTRYRISHFPFTEPSFEVDVMFESTQKWIEVLGSGMIHNNVLKNTNKNPKKIRGYAAGIGLERMAMLKWNIKDIRNFYLNDVEFLESVGK